MKKLLFLLIVCCSLNGFGQEGDSTIYKKYIDLKSVDSIFYQKQYYPNGSIKHEGWVIYETLRDSQNIQHILIPEGVVISIEMNIGRHVYYYPDGAIKDLVEMTSDLKAERSIKTFNNKGQLKSEIITKDKRVLPYSFIVRGSKDKKTRDYSNVEYRKCIYYIRGNIWYNEEYLSGYTKHGCWKVYKDNGLIKSEKYYQHGKLISKNCPK